MHPMLLDIPGATAVYRKGFKTIREIKISDISLIYPGLKHYELLVLTKILSEEKKGQEVIRKTKNKTDWMISNPELVDPLLVEDDTVYTYIYYPYANMLDYNVVINHGNIKIRTRLRHITIEVNKKTICPEHYNKYYVFAIKPFIKDSNIIQKIVEAKEKLKIIAKAAEIAASTSGIYLYSNMVVQQSCIFDSELGINLPFYTWG